MKKKEYEEKLDNKDTAILWIVFCGVVLLFIVFGVGHCTADPGPQDAGRGEIYTVYHVERQGRVKTEWLPGPNGGHKEVHYNVGYATVNDSDPDDDYQIIYLGENCMKNYKPDANFLKVGHGNDIEELHCTWLKTCNKCK